MDIDLSRLRYFLAVADELHFGRAARQLHITQPPLSQQIQRLEADLGVRLFDRTGRQVRLTDAGKALVADGKRLLAESKRTLESVQRAARGGLGRLAIGFVGGAVYEILPAVLGQYARTHPQVAVMVEELNSQAQVDALRHGRIDVGFLREPARDETVTSETIVRERVVVAVPTGHALADHPSVSLADLAGEPLIAYPRDQFRTFNDQFISQCVLSGFTPNIVIEATPMPAAAALVASGLGVAPLPATATFIQLAGVVYKPLEPLAFTLEIDAAWRTDSRSELVTEFRAVMREAIRSASFRAFTPA